MDLSRYYVTPEQWNTIYKQFKKYIVPLLLVFLLALQQGKPLDAALFVVYGAALQLLINFLSKLTTENK